VTLRLYNTQGRSVQDFKPIHDREVKMYCCGPTVYNYAHIGNLRSYVFEDTLRRTLELLDYSVIHVMNVTDVGHLTDDADAGEDKIIKSAREMGKTVWDIAEFFTNAFFEDTDALNILRPTVTCRATDHVQDMIDLIKRIEAKGYTYQAGGNVYFDTQKFPEYGKMALLDRQEEQQSRVDVDENKRHPRDFVLWFTKSKFEHQAMLWDSPWGRGYPGWHIECSAMSMKYLGEEFDIHCGGVDHIPVHHTNEIAQAESVTEHRWVHYWLHGEFLVMDSGKMSKSKGGFLTLASLVEDGYDPLDYRYFCLGGHYRTQLQFSFVALQQARNARLNLMDRLDLLRREVAGSEASPTGPEPSPAEEAADARTAGYRRQFLESLCEDLNVPKALAVLWTVVKDQGLLARERLELAEWMDQLFALELASAGKDAEERIDQDIQALIDERNEARKSKNFQRADEIRDTLLKKGIVLEDLPGGTRWKRAKRV
jgi:cysteinyl-tRNA synthetase